MAATHPPSRQLDQLEVSWKQLEGTEANLEGDSMDVETKKVLWAFLVNLDNCLRMKRGPEKLALFQVLTDGMTEEYAVTFRRSLRLHAPELRKEWEWCEDQEIKEYERALHAAANPRLL